MTKDDVANVLGVSVRTIENLVSAGIMPTPGRIGGRVLWHPNVFYTWLDQALRASSGDHLASEDEENSPAPALQQMVNLMTTVKGHQPGKPSAVARMQERQKTRLLDFGGDQA